MRIKMDRQWKVGDIIDDQKSAINIISRDRKKEREREREKRKREREREKKERERERERDCHQAEKWRQTFFLTKHKIIKRQWHPLPKKIWKYLEEFQKV